VAETVVRIVQCSLCGFVFSNKWDDASQFTFMCCEQAPVNLGGAFPTTLEPFSMPLFTTCSVRSTLILKHDTEFYFSNWPSCANQSSGIETVVRIVQCSLCFQIVGRCVSLSAKFWYFLIGQVQELYYYGKFHATTYPVHFDWVRYMFRVMKGTMHQIRSLWTSREPHSVAIS
jgi:hypothetical protein